MTTSRPTPRPSSRPDVRRAYTSTVVSWLPLALVLAVAVVVCGVLLATGTPWWAPLVVLVVLAVVGAQVGVARLSVGEGRLVARLGVLAVVRVDVARIEELEAVDLDWRQALGLGMPFGLWAKMTIRSGPALLVRAGRLRVRVSTPHPDDAIAAVRAEQAAGPSPHEPGAPRSWFGPKRVGVGLRPQTWQGWTLTLAVAAVVVLGAVLLGG